MICLTMGHLNRRSLCQTLPLLAFASTFARGQAAAVPATATKDCAEPILSDCQAFPFGKLPIRYSETGAATRQILEGRIPGSEVIELHETTLEAGKTPHPPHRHSHAELLLVRQGTIEFLSDDAPVRITAGGAAYCAPNKLHGFHNVGESQAIYFVVKVGSAPVCQK